MSVCKRFNLETLVWRDCEICSYVPEALPGRETQTLRCQNLIQGRYVRVHLFGDGYLTLCEVQVVGLFPSGERPRGKINVAFYVFCIEVTTL